MEKFNWKCVTVRRQGKICGYFWESQIRSKWCFKGTPKSSLILLEPQVWTKPEKKKKKNFVGPSAVPLEITRVVYIHTLTSHNSANFSHLPLDGTHWWTLSKLVCCHKLNIEMFGLRLPPGLDQSCQHLFVRNQEKEENKRRSEKKGLAF